MIALFLAASLYLECDVAVGKIQTCSATTFTGTTVLRHTDGRYRRCKVSNGRVHECAGWFSGIAPAVGDDGRWHRCRISTGRVQSCDATGYVGPVVTRRPG